MQLSSHDPSVSTATRVPAPAGAGTVHRRPVVTLEGHVVGYAVTVSLDAGTVPTQRGPQTRQTPEQVADAERRLQEAYLQLDLPNLVADRYVFIPATPAMLEGFVPQNTVPGRLVLILPAAFETSPDAVARAAVLKGLGVQLALEDYRGDAAQEALLPHVRFVVVRPGAGPLAPLVHHAHRLNIRVLATDVRDRAAEDECRAAGVDAVVGAQTERAATTTAVAPQAADPAAAAAAGARVLRAGEAQCMAVMHLLHQEDLDFPAVSQVIDTDPVLTLRVLHLVNSGAFALAHEIDTVSQAVVLLGSRELVTLVTALMLDARPDAMDALWLILARALTCETLMEDAAAYTVGMLSALAEQLGIPASVIVEKVGVSQAVSDAVRHQTGPFGSVLAAVRAHERADTFAVVEVGLDPAEVSDVYMQAVSDALATARAVTPGL